MISPYFFCALVILVNGVNAFVVNRTMEGYPAGFLPDCPGSMKPVSFTRDNLRKLEIYVSGTKYRQGKRTVYNYFSKDQMAKDPSMDYSKRTMFYIGGYMDTIHYPLGTTIEIYYKRRGYNVWILDSLRFMINEYPVAARFMAGVADVVSDMIINLEKANVGFDPKKFELSGFSLGAQSMGLIAKYYRKKTGRRFITMIALDPSGLCFRNNGPDERIDVEDADNIVAIMTNIDNWGSAAPIGHVNFYVNGGEKQPGQIQWTKCEVACCHFRAYFMYIASLDHQDQFIGVRCNSVQEARDNECYENKPLVTNVLGFNTDFSKPGIYYLPTNNTYPYFIGKKGLKKGNDAFSVYLREANKDDIVYI